MFSLIHGSAHHLPTLPDGSVQCIATSPPYYGLRAYDGEQGVEWPSVEYAPMAGLAPLHVPAMVCPLGHEPTPEAYIGHLILCLREWWRVLRDDGIAFVNLGDSYAGSGKGYGSEDHGKLGKHANRFLPPPSAAPCLKPKDLMMIPARFALAAQADGWYLRSDIIWAKPNPMPESVTDRPTKAHEYVFLIAKQERYFYDADAIREAHQGQSGWAKQRARGINTWDYGREGYNKSRIGGTSGKETREHAAGRNRRTVWTVATVPYPGAHFACWPPALVEPMIRAGTSERGCCAACGAPWVRVVERARTFESGSGRSGNLPVGKNGANLQGGGETLDIRRGPVVHTETTGWQPSCTCDAGEPVPCVVMDPFSGSGTTGRVAIQLGRRYIGVDISAEYLEELAPDRLTVQMQLLP